jgi:hypothetical protein
MKHRGGYGNKHEVLLKVSHSSSIATMTLSFLEISDGFVLKKTLKFGRIL